MRKNTTIFSSLTGLSDTADNQIMTLVENLQTWKEAVECYNEGDFQSSLDKFKEMKDSSAKIAFNIGRAYLSLCELQAALQVSIDGLYLIGNWIVILCNIY